MRGASGPRAPPLPRSGRGSRAALSGAAAPSLSPSLPGSPRSCGYLSAMPRGRRPRPLLDGSPAGRAEGASCPRAPAASARMATRDRRPAASTPAARRPPRGRTGRTAGLVLLRRRQAERPAATWGPRAPFPSPCAWRLSFPCRRLAPDVLRGQAPQTKGSRGAADCLSPPRLCACSRPMGILGRPPQHRPGYLSLQAKAEPSVPDSRDHMVPGGNKG